MTHIRLIEADQTRTSVLAPLSDVAEYAYAAVTEHVVYTAGACPLDAGGTTTPVDDVAGQAETCMANLEQALQAAGAGLTDVVKTTVYVASADQSDLVAAWEVVRDRFAPHRPPSTLLGVAVLGYSAQLVEIEAVACIARPARQPSITA